LKIGLSRPLAGQTNAQIEHLNSRLRQFPQGDRPKPQQLGVSRNVLRGALRSLEMQGFCALQKASKGAPSFRKADTSPRMNDVMRRHC